MSRETQQRRRHKRSSVLVDSDTPMLRFSRFGLSSRRRNKEREEKGGLSIEIKLQTVVGVVWFVAIKSLWICARLGFLRPAVSTATAPVPAV